MRPSLPIYLFAGALSAAAALYVPIGIAVLLIWQGWPRGKPSDASRAASRASTARER